MVLWIAFLVIVNLLAVAVAAMAIRGGAGRRVSPHGTTRLEPNVPPDASVRDGRP